ncbi:MAG: CopG family ribbon-helix-helix protein [Candidatus Aminicenantes bacterium]|jgi:predicted transcriptional regulator
MKETITIRVEPEIKEKLDQMAHATKRSKSYLASEALQEYIKLNEWQIKAIQEGIRQADEGQLISHEEIKDRWDIK